MSTINTSSMIAAYGGDTIVSESQGDSPVASQSAAPSLGTLEGSDAAKEAAEDARSDGVDAPSTPERKSRFPVDIYREALHQLWQAESSRRRRPQLHRNGNRP